MSVQGILKLIGLGATLASFLSLFAPYWWAFDLASHFRVQYLGGLCVAVFGLSVLHQYRFAGLFALVALGNMVEIAPYLPMHANAAPAGQQSIRAMMSNVLLSNNDYEALIVEVRRNDPDVLVLEEVDQGWLEALRPLYVTYPHRIERPQDNKYGIALFSKHPIDQHRVFDLVLERTPAVLARLRTATVSFYVFSTHVRPPISPRAAGDRDNQFVRIAEVVRAIDAPVLFIGDLNVTPWSPHFKKLLRDAGMQSAANGRGLLATWPSYMPLAWIPIDHALYSPGIEILDHFVGRSVGSDHYPIVTDFRVPAFD